MFYDETGKHIRTKKEILGEDEQIRAGCKVIPKGEVYERNLFTTKNARFKNEGFLEEVKRSYTDLINLYVKDDKQKLKVIDRNGVYLPMKKIGKNNPKAEQIIADNQTRTKWNLTVDSALVVGVSETQIMAVKRTQIAEPASKSIRQSGKYPELFSQLIKLAVSTLEMIIRRILDMVSVKGVPKEGARVTEEVTRVVAVPEKKTEVDKPERPKQSIQASKYLRLQEVYEHLLKQSRAIQNKKIGIEELEEEKSNLKGILKGRKRREVEEKIEQAKVQLANMENGMPAIVKPYGYKSVKEFMTDYNASKSEYEAYQQAVEKYEKGVYGKPAESIKERLKRYDKELKERENSRQHPPVRPKDRGGR